MKIISLRSIIRVSLVAALPWSVSSTSAEELAADIAVTKSHKALPYSAIVHFSSGPEKVKYDISGMRPLSKAPAAGVHPRILQSPEDRPALIKAYKETPYGMFMWDLVEAWTDKLKGKNIEPADFPTYPEGGLLGPFNRGGWIETSEDYRKVLAGDFSTIEGNLMNNQVLSLLCLELYRCWVVQDADGGRIAAGALTDIAQYLSKGQESGGDVSKIGGYHMGFGYDYGHGFMNDSQRDIVRKLIAKASMNQAHYGAFVDCDAATSNWCTLDSFMPFTLLAIEGEEGFNQNYYRSFAEAYQKFITYGWYESGVPYEGLGKNYQFNTTMIILTRRGINLTGHPNVKAYGQKFLPAFCLPSGKGFLGADDWGGTGGDTVMGDYRFNVMDAIGLKYLFPDDKKVDYVWQRYVGEDFRELNDLRPGGYYPSVLLAAMFPSQALMSEPNRDEAELPLTLFCPERGYLSTRSDNSEDALMLTMHTRQDKGGHTSADRNSFVFAGLGRLWGYQMNIAGGSKYGKVNESRFFSTVLVDDVGQCGSASGCFPVPGKMVDFKDSEMLTYATGDAKYAYDWEWNWENGEPGKDSPNLAKGWEKVLETPNDFQFKKVDLPFMDKPFYEQAHWLQPGMQMHYVKKPWNPVQKAFRTSALVRGAHSYALIVDDIQKDDQQHNYKWLMQASSDLEISSFAFSEDSEIADLYLCGREVPRGEDDVRRPRKGDPMLMVRVLQCDTDLSRRRYTPIGRLEQYMSNIRWPKSSGKRLVIPSYSVAPNYKIMLYPYRHGEALPETSFSQDGTVLKVEWPDQKDHYDIEVDEHGRTHMELTRSK